MTTALVVAAVASLPRHDYAGAWKFFLAGILAPGLSQLLFTLAIREVGPSRTSVTVGSAPLFALAIAFTFLNEPVRLPLVLGAVAIVAGGILLAAERGRPEHLRARGLLYALGAAVLFAVRDNIVRALHAHGSPETVAVSTMLAGLLIALIASRSLPSRREIRALAPAGLLFGASYVCSVRGVLPRPRLGRLAARRDRVALGRRARGARLRAQRGGGAAAAARRGGDRRRRRS